MKRQIFKTEDGSVSIRIPELNETYHSKHGAIQESTHIFIDSGLKRINKNQSIRIFEMGFGTGLNTYLSYLYLKENDYSAHYYSAEKYPLSWAESRKLNYPSIIGQPNSVFDSLHSQAWGSECVIDDYITFNKILGDLKSIELPSDIDLVYYDAFAPEIQPSLWTTEILNRMFMILLPGGIFVTYCAKGQVRRNLLELGFTVERLTGPPGKREILRATKPE